MTTNTNKTTICFIALLCASLALVGALAYASDNGSGNGDVADDTSIETSDGSYSMMPNGALKATATANVEAAGVEFWYEGLVYRVMKNGNCMLVDYDKNPGDVVVPDHVVYYGTIYRVTEIGEYGLSTKSIFGTLPRSVEIGPYIEKIGKKAMSANANVHDGYRSFTIRDIENSQLREIGEYAFEDAKIDRITLPASIKTIAPNAFYKCKGLMTVAVLSDKDTAFTIGWHAFKDCKALTYIDLEKATDIGKEAFESTMLNEIDLSSAVHVASDAFPSIFTLGYIVIGSNLSDDFKLFQKKNTNPIVFHDAEGNVLDSGNLILGMYKVEDFGGTNFYLVAE